MNLADLKRKMKIGQGIKLVQFGTTFDVNNKNLNIVRYVVRTQGNGVYLNSDKTVNKGSFLEFPKASLMEMNDKGFTIFEAGIRDLTPEEQKIRDNQPRDEEQSKIDMMTDSSTMFYRKKNYYKEQGYEYLFSGNSKTINGKYLIHNKDEVKIRDDVIKGKISLVYEFV